MKRAEEPEKITFCLLACCWLYSPSPLFGNKNFLDQRGLLDGKRLLRIPEYFTGKEYFGKQVVVRTDNDRAGLYFVLELNHSLANLRKNSSVLIRVNPLRSSGGETVQTRTSSQDDRKKRSIAGHNGR